MARRVISWRRSNSVRSEADIQRSFAALLGAYLGRFFTGAYVLSIRYLASLHDTAMKYLRFFLKNS